MRLNKVYPFIGDDATTPAKVDFGNINSASLTAPTATKSTATTAITGCGFIEITINGVNRNILMTLD